MNSAVTALAKRDQVVLVIGAAFSEREYVVDFLHRYQDSFLEAELAEGMLLSVGIADDLPVLSVTTLCCRPVTSVLLVLCVPFLLVLLTIPAVRQPRTPRIRTGFLRFVWHGYLLYGKTKAPEGLLPSRHFFML